LAYRYAVEEACYNFEASLQLLVSKLTTRSERRRSKKKKKVIKSAAKAHRNASTGQKHQAIVSKAEHCECTDKPVVQRQTNPSLVNEDVVINGSKFFKEGGVVSDNEASENRVEEKQYIPASEDKDSDEDFECADGQVEETQTTVSLVDEGVVINGCTTQEEGDIASNDERLQRQKKRAERRASLMSDGEQVSVSPGVYTKSAQDARTA
jgi:cytochrome c biogenesis protein ResB